MLLSKHFLSFEAEEGSDFLVPETVISVPPFWHPGVHFGTLESPWATLGAAGRTRGGPELFFQRFGFDLGIHFESFSGTES